MLNNISAIDLIKQKLSYIADRNNVIVNNITNVNAPKRTTKDLVPFSTDNKKGLKIARTQDNHIKGTNTNKFVIYNPKSDVQKLDGNNISLEAESIKLNQNNLERQQAIGIYNKVISMLNTASRNAK